MVAKTVEQVGDVPEHQPILAGSRRASVSELVPPAFGVACGVLAFASLIT